jgi:hypothetical protein
MAYGIMNGKVNRNEAFLQTEQVAAMEMMW